MASGIRPMMPSGPVPAAGAYVMPGMPVTGQQPMMTAMGTGVGGVGGGIRPSANQQLDPFGAL